MSLSQQDRHDGQSEANNKPADFRSAMKAAGHGKYQYSVFWPAAAMYFASGLQSAVNGYILPSAKCEFALSASQMGMLNSAFLVGGVITGLLWGGLSDCVGRRPVLMASTLLDSVFILGAVLSPSYPAFLVFRLLSGMMNTAPSCLSYLYLGEFVYEKKRSPFMIVLGATWTVAWTLLPAVAYAMVPQPWSVWLLGLRLGSWKLFLAMLLVPNLLAVALILCFPETPKYLHASGQEQAALAVLSRIYAVNTGGRAEDYPVKKLQIVTSALTSTSPNTVVRHLLGTLKNCWELLKPPVLSRTLLCCTMYFSCMFMVYGFSYWMPELLNMFQLYGAEHSGFSATVCEVVNDFKTMNITLEADDCSSESIINPTVFLDTLIVNAATVVVNISSFVGSRWIGRRAMSSIYISSAGIASLGLLFASNNLQLVVVCTLFMGFGDTTCIAINNLIVDIFPSRYSGSGVSSVMLAGRLGGAVANLIIGYLLDVSCEVPLGLFCAVGVGSGILACCAPRKYVEENDDKAEASSPAA